MKNWFDQECEKEKENLKSLGKQISQNAENAQLRTLLHEKKKSFKKTCKRKKCLYLSKKNSGHRLAKFQRHVETDWHYI